MSDKVRNPVFVIWAFAFQFLFIAYFLLRKTHFDVAVTHGWIVYALSLAGVLVSIQQIRRGSSGSFWIGGFLFFAWAVFGFVVEYVLDVSWRAPIVWPIFIPYIGLYLATVMFYWWPLAEIRKVYWYVYAALFAVSTYLNATSHATT